MSFIDTWIDKGLTRLGGMVAAKLGQSGTWGNVPLAQAGGYTWMDNPAARQTGQKMYNTLSWINAAISIPANIAAPVELNVEREGLEGDENEDIPNHPLEVKLKRPNPLMSRKEFLTATYAYYLMAGNAYWWINAASETAEPDELWIINPADIRPMTDSRLFIEYYEYMAPNGQLLQLPIDQICHFKRFNPENPFIGISAVETLVYQADADMGRIRNDANIYRKSNGTPPGILAFSDNFSNDQWSQMLRDFDEGARAMRRFLMLRNVKAGGVQWLQNQLSNRDQQVLETRGFTREEVFTVLAPGLASMLAINATEANSKTGKATLMEFVVYPMLCEIAEKITNDLLPRYGEGLEAKFEEVRTKDRVLEMQEQEKYNQTHTIAEIRKKYYKDGPFGDERDNLLPQQITAQSGAAQPEPPAPVMADNQPISTMPEVPAPDAQPTDQYQENVDTNGLEIDEMQAEVKRWRKVARKAIEAGKPIKDFVTDVIPPEVAATIRANLKAVKSLNDLDAAFVVEYGKMAPAPDLAEELRLARELLQRVWQPAPKAE